MVRKVKPVHFPVQFPEVFLRERPGFDVTIGNPPWEEATVEELGFWALRYPGLKGMPAGEQQREIPRLRETRPDLVKEYDLDVEEAQDLRRLLVRGPYPGMGTGDPDLYKAFCWRFWHLVRDGGGIGVVLPRSALAAAGSAQWRETVLDGGAFDDVTMLLNTGGWVFDDVHEQYVIGLVSVRKGAAYGGTLSLSGPFASFASWQDGLRHKPAQFLVADFRTWSEGASFPLLPSERSAEVFVKLRRHPRLDADEGWRVRPATEFHATNDKDLFVLDEEDADETMWPVYKGASFNIWEPDTGTRYAWADPVEITQVLQEKRLRQQRTERSPFAEFPRKWALDQKTLPCRSPRIAIRDVTNRLNARTVIAALIPANVVVTNQAPYLLWPKGDERDAAYLLGVLCSIPLDWYARRTVERHLNFHLFNALPVPRPARDDPVRRRVEEIAGSLAAVDRRYALWAKAVGVRPASVGNDDRANLVAELDALVGHLYGLDRSDLEHIFYTFREGWDVSVRVQKVLVHFENWAEGVK